MIWVERRGSRGDCRHLSPFPTPCGVAAAAVDVFSTPRGVSAWRAGLCKRRVPTKRAEGTVVAPSPELGIGSRRLNGRRKPMTGIEVKSFDTPDETRQFHAHGHAEVVQMHGQTVLRSVFEPGWHWKDDVAPIAGTDTCQTHHFGYMVAGRMMIKMDDGTEMECTPGQLVEIMPGHDAWVVGDVTKYATTG